MKTATAFYKEFMTPLKALKDDGHDFQAIRKPLGINEIEMVVGSVVSDAGNPVKRWETDMFHLKLFVANRSTGTLAMIERVRQLLSDRLAVGDYRLDVVNVLECPEDAIRDGILATPTLVKTAPGGSQRVIGRLSDAERLMQKLDLHNGNQVNPALS